MGPANAPYPESFGRKSRKPRRSFPRNPHHTLAALGGYTIAGLITAAALVIDRSAEEPGTWRLPFTTAVIIATAARGFAGRVPMITLPSILSMAVIGIASLSSLPAGDCYADPGSQ